MEERIPIHYQRGWPLASPLLDLELYRLLCIFSGGKAIASRTHTENDYSVWLRQNFEKSEASRLLISAAAILRNHLDSCAHPEENEKALHASVGSFKPNKESKKRALPLSFREACNKIIHADLIHYDFSKAKEPYRQYLRPFIHLYGFYQENEWKATIDILKFIDCGHCY
jgi:hypothetical protein